MEQSFLETYLHAFPTIEGWFTYDAALMFMAYNELLAEQGISGDVLEIGVHHGLSTIALAALRAPGAQLYAVDLFQELQSQNVSRSGAGNRRIFENNVRRFFHDLGFLEILSCLSSELRPENFERLFSFCHIDGGHYVEETYRDLKLSHDILSPGGLLALDDYFNPEFPGVCEAAIEFMRRHPGAMTPVAIGFNKILLQKTSTQTDLNAEFTTRFPAVPCKSILLWGTPTLFFPSTLRPYFDIHASTPHSLVTIPEDGLEAVLTPEVTMLSMKQSETVSLEVTVLNASRRTLPRGEGVLGLSYHVFCENGDTFRHDNDRVYLSDAPPPGHSRVVPLQLRAPELPGVYLVQIDLVWESVTWFKDTGNATPTVRLTVFSTLPSRNSRAR